MPQETPKKPTAPINSQLASYPSAIRSFTGFPSSSTHLIFRSWILSVDPSFCWILEPKRMHNKNAMDDRLSSLPDDLIHKILSYMSIKDAIRTSVLSSRWKIIWTSMPYLNFENQPHLSEFISNVFSHRNNQIPVSSLNLLLGRTDKDNESVTRIIEYTFSHNVQQLSITRSNGKILEFPCSFIKTPRWDLPFLTTLHLQQVKLSDSIGFFSKCINLKNLFLERCSMKNNKVLYICNPRLSDLTLQQTESDEGVNVIAPQLKSLTMIWCKGKHMVDAPGLTSLVIEGLEPWRLSTTAGFHSLDKVDLLMYDPYEADAHEIVSLFQQFRTIKLLTLNFGILSRLFAERKVLASSMERIPHKAFAFPNAKIVNFSPEELLEVYLEVGPQEKVTRPTDITPIPIFPMVSHEELAAMWNMTSALVFVERMGLFLEECNANTNARLRESEVEMHWAWELQWKLGELIGTIRHYKFEALEDCMMMSRIKEEYAGRLDEGERPMSDEGTVEGHGALFQRIEELITEKLPASKRAVMLPVFLSLCEDAAILTLNMLAWMYIQRIMQFFNLVVSFFKTSGGCFSLY